MKKLLHSLIFVLLPFFLFSQAGTTVFYDDNFGTGDNLPFAGTVNGKFSYSGTANGSTITISWSSTNSRWEIDIAPPGVGVTFVNTTETATNPPDLNTGTWTDIAMDGTELQALSGDGTTNVLLPAELIRFQASLQPQTVLLNWATASEINNAGFEIQRSIDGHTFEKIDFVEGRGSSTAINEYLFEDFEVQKDMQYYYRLKQIDYDGRFEFSEVVTISNNSNTTTIGELFPNPVKSDDLTTKIFAEARNDIHVSIFENSGKLISIQRYTIEKGNNLISLDITKLSNGLYWAKFVSDQNIISRSFSVQK